MIKITSMHNKFIKELKKLSKKKEREAQGRYLIEGEHLVQEALASSATVQGIIVTAAGEALLKQLSGVSSQCPIYLAKEEVFNSISAVPAPQGIVALVELKETSATGLVEGPILVLDNVQDPGNVGTMIRTADAANFKSVILGKGCADIYNDKVLRSMQGSHFHLDVVRADLMAVLPELKKSRIDLFGTELNPQAFNYQQLKKQTHFALIMGNEGQGVSKEVLALTDKTLYIPIPGQAESLNVAVAAGILMFALT